MTEYPSAADIAGFTAAQLVATHNRFSDKKVARFASRGEGAKRTIKLIETLRIAEAGRVPVLKEEPAKVEPPVDRPAVYRHVEARAEMWRPAAAQQIESAAPVAKAAAKDGKRSIADELRTRIMDGKLSDRQIWAEVAALFDKPALSKNCVYHYRGVLQAKNASPPKGFCFSDEAVLYKPGHGLLTVRKRG